MNFKDLDKETKQKIGLAGMIVLGLLWAGYHFGLSPLKERVAQLQAETEELDSKISKTQRALKRERSSKDTLDALSAELQSISSTQLPPLENPLSWVSSRLNSAARMAGVKLDSVEGARSGAAENAGRHFKTFGVRVSLSGSYFDLIGLLSHLVAENAYVAVTDLSVRSDDRSPNSQRMSMIIEWPVWSNRAGLEEHSQ